MRLVTPGDTAPASVNRYLLPHEHVNVITVRKHPAILLRYVLEVFGGLIIAAVLSNRAFAGNDTALLITWWAWLLVLIRFVWMVAEWSVDYFVVTTSRMLLTTGLITRNVAMMPLSKVTDMRFERPLIGRFLGYGTFIMESAGQDQALRVIKYIPYPERLYLDVCNLIFPCKHDTAGKCQRCVQLGRDGKGACKNCGWCPICDNED